MFPCLYVVHLSTIPIVGFLPYSDVSILFVLEIGGG